MERCSAGFDAPLSRVKRRPPYIRLDRSVRFVQVVIGERLSRKMAQHHNPYHRPRRLLRLPAYIAAILLAPRFSTAQSFPVVNDQLGTIYDSHTNMIGTAFSAGSRSHIITCAHVAASDAYLYQWANTNLFCTIKLIYVLPRYDLAVFQSELPLPSDPLRFGDIHRIRPGDLIVYAGRDGPALKVSATNVLAVGTALNEGANIDFLEFAGRGVPGYSGGPVFNLQGQIIAIMREAWTKRGVKGGDPMLMNRAFSTDILSVLHEQVFVNAPTNPPTPSKQNMDLLDLLIPAEPSFSNSAPSHGP
jgi:S1-C subfamily serine protease